MKVVRGFPWYQRAIYLTSSVGFKVSLRPLVQGMIADLGDDAAAQVWRGKISPRAP